jgi:nicotinamide-nucleotide amidase
VDVGILAVGTELVVGDQVDTNSAWLSQQVVQVGGDPVLHVAAPDDLDRLVDALRYLVRTCDAVIVGGGLGPTPDDLTREAVARVAAVDLEHRDDLEEAIRARFDQLRARMGPSNLQQARIPAGATAWPPVGTAPGFVMQVEGVPVYALPGVPWEMKELFALHVEPDLLGRAGGRATVTRIVHVTGQGESAVAEQLADIESDAGADGVALAYLATRHEVQVKLIVHGRDRDEAMAASQPWVDQVLQRLGPVVAGVDAGTVEQAVLDLLRASAWTLAVAESATAGMVCSRLAEHPGTSGVLKGGLVVYATDSKVRVAGLDQQLLDDHPPVSGPVTRALARAVREQFGADYGLATTGVAGPEPQDGVPVGTVFWAVAGPDGEVDDGGREFVGDREAIRGRLGTAALELLRRRLLTDRDGGR